jgi:hypothetical protein
MFTNKLRTAIIAIAAAGALAVPASAFATNPVVWRTLQGSSGSGQPTDSANYTLANWNRVVRTYAANGVSYADTGQDLVYGNQTWGVDLNWYTPRYQDLNDPITGPGPQWRFVRQNRSRLIHQFSGTERVALYNTANHQYLADGHETFGVNVVWSATPRFEWQVATGQSNIGTYGGSFTELYNTTEQAYLINGHETWGIDLVWLHAPFSLPNGYTPPESPYQSGGLVSAPPTLHP